MTVGAPVDPTLLAIGSYTQPVPHAFGAPGAGLSILSVDVMGEAVEPVLVVTEIPSPAYLTPHPTEPVLYAVSEIWGAPGTVSALRFSPDWRELVDVVTLPSGGTVPSYVSVYGPWLLLSNYGDGSLATFALSAAGDLLEQRSLLPLTGSGPDRARQDGPHAHCLLAHPSNGFVYAADLGADALLQLTVSDGGELTMVSTTPVAPGAGPRHLLLAVTTGYLVEELSSTMAWLDIAADGSLHVRSRVTMLPADNTMASTGADLALTGDGASLLASNRGHDSVVTYQRGPAGEPEHPTWTATGRTPRSLALSPSGALAVACQDSDLVQGMQLTGGGLHIAWSYPTGSPSCVKWLPELARR